MKNYFTKKTILERISGWGIILILAGILMNLQPILASNSIELQDGKKEVSGVITDKGTGEKLAGVTVMVKGTNAGTITNIDGMYTIKVSDTDELIFKFIGYTEVTIPVGTQTEINLGLEAEVIGMDEVVVVGYGVQKKKLVTGATVQVKSEDLVKKHVTRVESALQGVTPGMVIVKKSGQPGSDFNINIRGLGSVNGNDPLVLIDGVPGNFNTINPSDVESIDVLKDAASAAIYGSRAANGVVLITTKKGKAGEAKVSYDFYYGISNPTKKIDVLNAKEYAMIMNEESYNKNPSKTLPFTQEEIDALGEGTDWQKEAGKKNAPSQSHYFNVTGGTEKTVYSISLSYSREEGIFNFEHKSEFERYGLRINSEHKVKKFLKIGENLTYTHRNTKGLGVSGIYDNFMRSLIQSSPLIQAYDTNVSDGFGRSWNSPVRSFVPAEEQINPLAAMHYNYNDKKKNDDFVGDVYAEIEFFKGLKFRTDFGATLGLYYMTSGTDSFTLTSQTVEIYPKYKMEMKRDFGYNFDNVLTYERNVGKHGILVMVGMNAQDNRYFKMVGTDDGYLINNKLSGVLSNVAAIRDTATGDFGLGDSRFSYFGRLSYNYNEKYLATFSFRRDGSSKFGPKNRFGNFPAFSIGWVINKEKFLETQTWLDYLKLRASWGKNGKEPVDPYQFMATVGYENKYYYFNDQHVGVSPDKLPAPDLRWESSKQTDIGFDSRFLKNFRFAFDWYKKTSGDWIVQVQVPSITGIAGINESTLPYKNGGNVINKGVEFDLGYTKVMGDIAFDVSANFAYNQNEVTSVESPLVGQTGILYNGSNAFFGVKEGYPIGYFYGYKTNGIFQTNDEAINYVNSDGERLQPNAVAGDVRRVDANNNGIVDGDIGDRVMLGDPNPDYTYGFNLSTSYKGFDFSINLSGQAGHQIVMCYRDESRGYYNYSTDILDRWTSEGTSNRIPRVTDGTDKNQNWKIFSDLYVYDADFLKIKSINLGYDLVKLSKKIPFEQLRLYFSVSNLYTFTKYPGLDPEVGYGSSYDSAGKLRDAYASGVDLGFYPSARTYLFGLNVKF